MVLSDYTYVFVIGTFFAMLDAYNNGASMFDYIPTIDPY
jgi:sodium-dependent phosphate transporter